METSRIARLAGAFGIAALVLFAAGPALIQLGVLDGWTGFRIFGFGALLGLIALVLGLLGLFFTRAAAYRAGRGRALLGAGLGALVVAITLGSAMSRGNVPPINDITTNPADPPVFASDPSGGSRDMSYPAGNAELQRAGYPDLAPIAVALAPADALARISTLFESFGWPVTRTDPVAMTLEATDTSKLFRFVDDIVVRVKPQDGGSLIDMRSKSRVGRGDLGANAARIRKLRDALNAPR